jgi:hypothetical protein
MDSTTPEKANLFSLPRELRDMIWQLIVQDEVVIVEYKNDTGQAKGPTMPFPQTVETRNVTITPKDLNATPKRFPGNDRDASRSRSADKELPSFKRSELNLLLVSKQVSIEFEEHFYFGKNFKFHHNRDFIAFIDMMGPRTSLLRSLSIPVLASCIKLKHLKNLQNDLLLGFTQLTRAFEQIPRLPKLEIELLLKFEDREMFQHIWDQNEIGIGSYHDLFHPLGGRLPNLGELAVKVRFAGEGEGPRKARTKYPPPPPYPSGYDPEPWRKEIERNVVKILRSKACVRNSLLWG